MLLYSWLGLWSWCQILWMWVAWSFPLFGVFQPLHTRQERLQQTLSREVMLQELVLWFLPLPAWVDVSIWLQVLLLVSLLFGVGHAPTSNSDFILITSVLVLDFFCFCFLVKLSKGRKTCLAAVLALCSCDHLPCPLCLQSLLFLWNLFSQFTCSHWLWIYISSL